MGPRWTPGKYRWRTRLRGFLPLAVTRFIAKGRGDCGNHEWYKCDATKDHCYHCGAERPTEITGAAYLPIRSGVVGHSGGMADPTDLQTITSLIHDEYFDVDRVAHDTVTNEVRITIYPGAWKKRLVGWTGSLPDPLPEPLGVLVIRGVESMTIRDEARIGYVDIKRITYDDQRREVCLTSNIPVDVRMRVDGVDVELVRS